eukprot:c346_g1_i1.p1 GENE.c346_g1_i1~~c346_g1_i1.p1  ORF type:complete len:780 (+),score=158.88 c346_g1_i1:424-2763(+)
MGNCFGKSEPVTKSNIQPSRPFGASDNQRILEHFTHSTASVGQPPLKPTTTYQEPLIQVDPESPKQKKPRNHQPDYSPLAQSEFSLTEALCFTPAADSQSDRITAFARYDVDALNVFVPCTTKLCTDKVYTICVATAPSVKHLTLLRDDKGLTGLKTFSPLSTESIQKLLKQSSAVAGAQGGMFSRLAQSMTALLDSTVAIGPTTGSKFRSTENVAPTPGAGLAVGTGAGAGGVPLRPPGPLISQLLRGDKKLFYDFFMLPSNCDKVLLAAREGEGVKTRFLIHCSFEVVTLARALSIGTDFEYVTKILALAMKDRDFHVAVSHARTALHMRPRDPEISLMLATCLQHTAKHSEAVSVALNVLASTKNPAFREQAFLSVATSSRVRGFYNEGVHYAKKGLEEFPESTKLLMEIEICEDGLKTNSSFRPDRWVEADAHALSKKFEGCTDVAEVAHFLSTPFKLEEQKVRAFFRWICENISYDVESLLTGNYGDTDVSAEGVLFRRVSVCHGYSNLLQAMCDYAGCECAVVEGFAHSPALSSNISEPNHAWNAVKIDGRYQLIDCTWGSGTLSLASHAGEQKKPTFRRMFAPHYFFVPPHRMILTHLPTDDKFQLIPRRVDGPNELVSPQKFAEFIDLTQAMAQMNVLLLTHKTKEISMTVTEQLEIAIQGAEQRVYMEAKLEPRERERATPEDLEAVKDFECRVLFEPEGGVHWVVVDCIRQQELMQLAQPGVRLIAAEMVLVVECGLNPSDPQHYRELVVYNLKALIPPLDSEPTTDDS